MIANDRGFEVCTLSDCVDGYVPSLKPASLEMLHFSDGLFGWVADSKSLVEEVSELSVLKPQTHSWSGDLDISSLAAAYTSKSLTPTELVEKLYARIEEYAKIDPAVFIKLFRRKISWLELPNWKPSIREYRSPSPLRNTQAYRQRLNRHCRGANNSCMSGIRLHTNKERDNDHSTSRFRRYHSR